MRGHVEGWRQSLTTSPSLTRPFPERAARRAELVQEAVSIAGRLMAGGVSASTYFSTGGGDCASRPPTFQQHRTLLGAFAADPQCRLKRARNPSPQPCPQVFLAASTLSLWSVEVTCRKEIWTRFARDELLCSPWIVYPPGPCARAPQRPTSGSRELRNCRPPSQRNKIHEVWRKQYHSCYYCRNKKPICDDDIEIIVRRLILTRAEDHAPISQLPLRSL